MSASVSLGYDVGHETAKTKLLEAIETAELQDGFVRVTELLDHAVLYQAYGLLTDTKKLLLARSRLREAILKTLHAANIEIASPSHMIQRRLDDGLQAVPAHVIESATSNSEDSKEKLIFDKAEAAEKTETLRERREALKQQLAELPKDGDKDLRGKLERQITGLDQLLEARASQKNEQR